MLAFDIYINGKRRCTVGMDKPGVVSSIVTWVRSARAQSDIKKATAVSEELGLSVTDAGTLIQRWTEYA